MFGKLHIHKYNPIITKIVCETKDVLLDRNEHIYLSYCSNLLVNGCFSICNPHKYHASLKRDHAV